MKVKKTRKAKGWRGEREKGRRGGGGGGQKHSYDIQYSAMYIPYREKGRREEGEEDRRLLYI